MDEQFKVNIYKSKFPSSSILGYVVELYSFLGINAVFGNDRDSMRQYYCDCWKKEINKEPLEPLEVQIVQIIKEHPEYHTLLAAPERAKSQEYFPERNETNPFLHMSMHLSIREQMSLNRPTGISELLSGFILKFGDHEAEHEIMDCLAEAIWQSQQDGSTPDEQRYLACLKTKLRSGK